MIPSRKRRVLGSALVAAGVACGLSVWTSPAAAQVITGRVLDAESGQPVVTAGVFLLDSERNRVDVYVADSTGNYLLEVPEAGEYSLFAQRLGYFETESPLFSVSPSSAGRTYTLDLEMRAEPIALDPIIAVVENERMESWLRRELGVNPNTIYGFRAYQGQRVAEARARADNSTELLRNLYIPVSHGAEVCLGYGVPSVARGSPSMRGWSEAMKISPAPCGRLVVDDMPVPTAHIDSIDHRRVAVVVYFPGQVRLYTRTFDWTFKPGG